MSTVPRVGRPLAKKPKAGYHRPTLRLAPALYDQVNQEAERQSVSSSEFVRVAIEERLARRATPKGRRADIVWAREELETDNSAVSREGYPLLRLILPHDTMVQVRAHAATGGETYEDWMADAVTMRLERLAQEGKGAK